MQQGEIDIEEPAQLPLEVLAKFIVFEPSTFGALYTPAGIGRRAGEVGKVVGTLGLLHTRGYAVILRFPDGKLDSFDPMELLPANG